MYTLSDILDVINSNLEFERKQRSIKAKGHFSFSSCSFNEEDGVAWDNIISFFVDEDHCYPVVRVHHVLGKDAFGKKEEENHKFNLLILKELFQLLRFGKGEFSYDRFVDGTFDYNGTVF